MATKIGTAGVVKFGSNAVGEIVNFNVDETCDVIESTSITDTIKSFHVGRKSATATIECHWDADDVGQEALDVGAKAELILYPEGTTSGDNFYRGQAIVTGASVGVTLDGVVSRTFNVQFEEGLTHSEV